MNDRKIDSMLKTNRFTKDIWKGFLAPDLILDRTASLKTFPQLWFVNNAPTYTGGEHWCVLFIFQDHCEFFDPFGRSPVQNGVQECFVNQCKRIIFNGTQYQSIVAKTCGHHCIFFSVQRAQGKSLSSIKEMYSQTDLQRNDDMVFNFIWGVFGKMFAEYDLV